MIPFYILLITGRKATEKAFLILANVQWFQVTQEASWKTHFLCTINIGVRASFARGGGKPFAQKILASCPNFYETVKKKRGSYHAPTYRPKYEVKIFFLINLSYELVGL